MRDEHYTPFQRTDPQRRETVTVFVMARLRGDLTDSMRGSLRAGPQGWEAVYLLNGELYRTQFCATEALARADLATHRDLSDGVRLAAGAVSAVTSDHGCGRVRRTVNPAPLG